MGRPRRHTRRGAMSSRRRTGGSRGTRSTRQISGQPSALRLSWCGPWPQYETADRDRRVHAGPRNRDEKGRREGETKADKETTKKLQQGLSVVCRRLKKKINNNGLAKFSHTLPDADLLNSAGQRSTRPPRQSAHTSARQNLAKPLRRTQESHILNWLTSQESTTALRLC